MLVHSSFLSLPTPLRVSAITLMLMAFLILCPVLSLAQQVPPIQPVPIPPPASTRPISLIQSDLFSRPYSFYRYIKPYSGRDGPSDLGSSESWTTTITDPSISPLSPHPSDSERHQDALEWITIPIKVTGKRDGKPLLIRYQCSLPPRPPSDAPSSLLASTLATEEEGSALPTLEHHLQTGRKQSPKKKALRKAIRALTEMPCLYNYQSYWTYEFCFHGHVRQFHSESQEDFIKKRASQTRLEFILGTQRSVGIEEEPGLNEGEMVSFVVVDMTNGTVCDLSDQPRRTRVEIRCINTGRMEYIESLRETSSCHYSVEILTPRLCFGSFVPKPKVSHKIACYPEMSLSHVANVRKLEGPTKFLTSSTSSPTRSDLQLTGSADDEEEAMIAEILKRAFLENANLWGAGVGGQPPVIVTKILRPHAAKAEKKPGNDASAMNNDQKKSRSGSTQGQEQDEKKKGKGAKSGPIVM